MTNLDSILKSRNITLSKKVCLVKAMVFPVVMYGCKNWTIKKAECRKTDAFEVVLEKTLESPLDCKEIQPVHPKGDQSWVFIGRTDVEAESLILWPPDAKSWLIGKDSDAGKDWGQEEKGMTEDEMVGWHHQLNGHGIGWTVGVGDGQGGLACCGSWDRKESDMTATELNWTLLWHLIVSLGFIYYFMWFWQPTPVLLPGKSHGRLQSMGSQKVRHDWATSLHFIVATNLMFMTPKIYTLKLNPLCDGIKM